MTIQIPYPLLRSCENQIAPDEQFKRRMNLADRIQSCAEPAVLGPHFRQVQLVPMLDDSGPRVAVFTFQAVPGLDVRTQVVDLIPLVSSFVEVLTD
jgi:hypothetical protein